MEVLDIVRTAAVKSGVVPSFNPDEFPEDVLNTGKAALADEILPTLNCDRTIDITVTSRIYTPVNGKIVLRPLRQPTNIIVLGYSNYASTQLATDKWAEEIARFDQHIADQWPTDDFGEPLVFAMWATDMLLVAGTSLTNVTIREENIDFPPMRVDAVLEDTSRYPFEYTYRDEFERTVHFQAMPGVYTTEEYDDKLIILINGSQARKCVVLPVPLQIVNADHEHAGTIIAPEKFRRYLIDCTAVSLAVVYGVSTLPTMQQQAAVSYNLLKKNKPQPLHAANVDTLINNKLRNGVTRGRRFYADL